MKDISSGRNAVNRTKYLTSLYRATKKGSSNTPMVLIVDLNVPKALAACLMVVDEMFKIVPKEYRCTDLEINYAVYMIIEMSTRAIGMLRVTALDILIMKRLLSAIQKNVHSIQVLFCRAIHYLRRERIF